ncbi:hypothetical protein QUF61_12685 [Candidatus Venteria ishoeyi]|uniref:type II toxin-antitoxin system RelE family toxin n=1 Tax=Candidatus Venteria ishoeyi TaxID=1899563 RepID=UPI0025A5AA73|nr:hypothetical protein [Candidatus Venteria ishoeyi]MDM8547346.1 hypothetical protein [Candidatus Venteria ishoeyi]
MRFYYSRTFEKKFSKYDQKLQKKIFDAIQALPEGDVKQMVGNNIPVIYRLRVSKYRILFQMKSGEVKILKVDTRGDIYK